jgi:DNA-binding transcriptional LysR family regulator
VIAARASADAEQLSGILAGQEVPLEMLSRLPLIGLDRSSGIRRQIERAFANYREPIRFGVNAAGWLAVKEYAKHGLGVGILPLGLLSREDADELVVRRLPSEVCICHYLIHRKDATSPYLKDMKASLAEAAKQHQETVQRLCHGLV